MTQWITFQCPAGHKLGQMNAALVDLMGGFGSTAGVSVHPGSFDCHRGFFRFRCEGCARSGATATALAVRADRVAAVLAAQYAYGPAHATVTATIKGLRDALARIIPANDPARDERRKAYDAVLADLTPPVGMEKRTGVIAFGSRFPPR